MLPLTPNAEVEQLRATVSEQYTAIEELTQRISELTVEVQETTEQLAKEQQRELLLLAENETLNEQVRSIEKTLLESLHVK